MSDSFLVEDRRTARFGVVYRHTMDCDAFRALSPSTRLVYIALLTFAGRESHQAWPKVRTLARIVGVSERTTWRAINSLRSSGFIEVSKRWFTSTRRVNLYTLTDPS